MGSGRTDAFPRGFPRRQEPSWPRGPPGRTGSGARGVGVGVGDRARGARGSGGSSRRLQHRGVGSGWRGARGGVGAGGRRLRLLRSRRPQAQGDPRAGPAPDLPARVTALLRDLTVFGVTPPGRASLPPSESLGLAQESGHRSRGGAAHPSRRGDISAARSAPGRWGRTPETIKMYQENIEKKSKIPPQDKTPQKQRSPGNAVEPQRHLEGESAT